MIIKRLLPLSLVLLLSLCACTKSTKQDLDPNFQVVEFTEFKSVLEFVREFYAEETQFQSLNILSDQWKTSLAVHKTKTLITVGLSVESAGNLQYQAPHHSMSGTYNPERPTEKLKVNHYIDPQTVESLKFWASENGIKHELAFYETHNEKSVEYYIGQLNFYINDNLDSAIKMLAHLNATAFDNDASKWTVRYFKPIDSAPSATKSQDQ